MHTDHSTSDAQYHWTRVEQERDLIQRAGSPAARDCHAELMRLHQLRHDSLSRPR